MGWPLCYRIMDMSTRECLTRHTLNATVLIALAGIAHADPNDEPVSGQIIAELVPGASVNTFNGRYGTSTLDSIASRNIYLLSLPEGMTRDEFEILTFGDLDLDHFELNFSATDPGGDTRSFYGGRSTNDYRGQAAASALNLPQAHSISTGSGVTVAVIDTGVDADHVALVSNLVQGWNFVTNTGQTDDVPRGVDSSGNGNPDEFVGHGTMIAGMIHLVAPDAQIMPIVALDSDGRTTSFTVAKAIYYAIDKRVNVINLSLGTSAPDEDVLVLRDAVDEARRHWITVVASAGNLGHTGNDQYPAAFQENRSLAVGACDWQDQVADFTNIGDHVIVTAPGIDTIGTFVDGGYQIGEGTSFSTAWVSGTAALINAVGWDHSPRKVARHIERSAAPFNNLPLHLEGLVGGGVLDAHGALLEHTEEPPCPADMNDDDMLSPTDFTAWVIAYQDGDFSADQNRDRYLTPSDFTAWITNFNIGCQ
ncbi:MAG: hypothetical protein ED559_08665 [Phycisphaera sp.]|nr:MAG: hypothetical protein ED559_08665 [Phycisphaera sp.]